MSHDVPPAGPPSQPPYAGGPSRGSFDPASVNKLDWAILGIGAVVLIFSFFDYYSWDFKGYGINVSQSWSAWHFSHGLFIAWFAMVITVLSAAVLAVSLFVPTVTLPAPPRMLSFVGFAVGFVLYLIAIFAHSDFGPAGGHAFSFWISLILAGVGAVIALMRAQQTNTVLPGRLNSLPRVGR
ncbi:hypothetical protein [Actinacidiphila alni]|uniref:Uncharacterized protein n=1 Tax=Actinacidiphila alni TaxID=380248 RepID=A0A1I2ALZ3_9ACTN|nr:hypothetical protein [Actinacidiphila alni]SFE44769.1 hypothetical protein SAMN05216251_103135 [Actinacidiphila alni]